MKLVDSVVNFLATVTKAIMVLLSSVMVVSMFFQVVTRYLLDTGIPWTEELARFSNVWLIFLGASLLVYTDEHIKVTVLDSILKGTALKVLHLFRNLVYFLYSLVVVKVGIDTLSIVSLQTSANMRLPMNYVYFSIPLGGILTIIYYVHMYLPKKNKEEVTPS